MRFQISSLEATRVVPDKQIIPKFMKCKICSWEKQLCVIVNYKKRFVKIRCRHWINFYSSLWQYLEKIIHQFDYPNLDARDNKKCHNSFVAFQGLVLEKRQPLI